MKPAVKPKPENCLQILSLFNYSCSIWSDNSGSGRNMLRIPQQAQTSMANSCLVFHLKP